MKAGLAVAAVMVALLVGAMTGGVLTATGDEPPAGVAQSRTADEDASPQGNPAARAFVAAKKAWTACVAKAAPARDAEDGRFDPEQACGTKPHPHDFPGKHEGHGPPAWSGGPDRRTAEPPGPAKQD